MLNERAKRLLAEMPKDFEAALIGTEVSRFYLLDFDAGDAGTLLLLPERMVYIVDSRYIEAAGAEVKCAEVVLEQDALEQVRGVLKSEGVKRLHLESGITLAALARLKEKLPDAALDTSDALSGAIAGMRRIKDGEELGRMRRAQEITDACFSHILPYIKEGVRERDLMLEMEHFMRANGAGSVAFDTICVAGAKTSLPHGVPGDNRVRPGDFITLDFGAKYKGYCADMTRTVALGEPKDEKRRVYQTVLSAHLAGMAAARAGAACRGVDRAARDIIDAAGYKGAFGHGLGHSLGIEVHEGPRFSPKSDDVALAGMVLSVEPGIYLAGRFGCRIEDTVLIEEGGCASLAKSDKRLLVL